MSFPGISNPVERLYQGYYCEVDDTKAKAFLFSSKTADLVRRAYDLCRLNGQVTPLHAKRFKYLSTEQAMIDACTAGSLGVAKVVHAARIPLDLVTDDRQVSLMYYAAQNGYINLVRWLLDNHAPSTIFTIPLGRTPFHAACEGAHFVVVRDLLPHVITSQLDSNGATALKLAADYPDRQKAARLAICLFHSGVVATKQQELVSIGEAEAAFTKTVPEHPGQDFPVSQLGARGPVHQILGRLTLIDLMSARGVCRQWNYQLSELLVQSYLLQEPLPHL